MDFQEVNHRGSTGILLLGWVRHICSSLAVASYPEPLIWTWDRRERVPTPRGVFVLSVLCTQEPEPRTCPHRMPPNGPHGETLPKACGYTPWS